LYRHEGAPFTGDAMPTYVSLINWTEQGIRNYAHTVERADTSRELARRMGGELKAIYWTLGPYDIVAIAEFPDDETATAFMLALGSQGNLRTTTMRAFDDQGTREIIGKVG
jgi:uncharacterized protein with GYD domain